MVVNVGWMERRYKGWNCNAAGWFVSGSEGVWTLQVSRLTTTSSVTAVFLFFIRQTQRHLTSRAGVCLQQFHQFQQSTTPSQQFTVAPIIHILFIYNRPQLRRSTFHTHHNLHHNFPASTCATTTSTPTPAHTPHTPSPNTAPQHP